jgi:hypothetical protein
MSAVYPSDDPERGDSYEDDPRSIIEQIKEKLPLT